jgi:hypothetical protein
LKSGCDIVLHGAQAALLFQGTNMSEDFNAYASPQAEVPNVPAVPRERQNFRPYLPIGRRAKAAMIFLALGIVMDLAVMASTVMEIDLLKRMNDANAAEDQPTQAEIEANDNRQMAIGLTMIGVFIPTVVLFCMWIYRAHWNLPALGAAQLKYTPGWAAGAFFVPILNLFRPYQITKEIDLNSDPSPDPRSSPLIGVWWTAWLVTNFSARASERMTSKAETLDSILAADYATIGALAIEIVAAVLAILVVRRISRNQESLYALWQQQGDDVVADAVIRPRDGRATP